MFLLFPLLLLLYVAGGLLLSLMGARWAGKRFESRLVPWMAFALLFTVIFGDEIFGYFYWQHLCKTQGGLHVYKRVPVEGFFIEGNVSEGIARDYLKPSYFSRDIYRFVEGKDEGQLYRFTSGTGNAFDIRREAISKSVSKLTLSPMRLSQYPHYVWSVEYSADDHMAQERIGLARSFGYKGATVIRFLRRITGADFEGSASYCPTSRLDIVREAMPPMAMTNQGDKHE